MGLHQDHSGDATRPKDKGCNQRNGGGCWTEALTKGTIPVRSEGQREIGRLKFNGEIARFASGTIRWVCGTLVSCGLAERSDRGK